MAAFIAALPGVAASPGPLTPLGWRSKPGALPGYRSPIYANLRALDEAGNDRC